jgi:LacI family transcriptional regulator
MGATVRDIAKQVGLSVTTVSRALNDHSDVAPATKARIRAVADRLNYHPNAAARTLKMDRANALGLVVPLGLHRSYDPFWLEFIGGMAATCARHGVDLLLSATDGMENARTSFLRLVQGRRVDGLVVCDIRTEDSRVAWLQELEIPFVAFGRTVGEARYWYVDVDGAAGALGAMLYLIHLGHRRIAYLGLDPTFGFSHFRLAGYREALQRSAIPYDADLISEGLTEETAQRAVEAMLGLSNPPTALLASSDFVALAALRAARHAGLSVPRDLSVIAFDDNLAVQRVDPPLTAVGQPNRRLGEEAGELLLDQLRQPERGPFHRLIDPSLIIRSSTGPRTVGTKGDATGATVA